MLSKFLELLSQDFEIEVVQRFDGREGFIITVGGLQIDCTEEASAICLYGELGSLPQKNDEECLAMVMKANFLGQGTGGGVIGLMQNEKILTISSTFSSNVGYDFFKEQLEVFINYFEYWQKEILKYYS